MMLSVVIVSWNTAALLAACLRSLPAGTVGMNAQILVIDNASTDSSADLVMREFPHVQLIRNMENVGFGRANNQGLRASAGRYILL